MSNSKEQLKNVITILKKDALMLRDKANDFESYSCRLAVYIEHLNESELDELLIGIKREMPEMFGN